MSKLWDKGQPLDAAVEEYTVGDDPVLDLRLLPYDVRASRAHARMLRRIGVLDAAELAGLEAGLDTALAAHGRGGFRIERADEDVHTALERWLVAAAGVAGEKIHTARSRNDQVLTALRLWQRDAVEAAGEAVDDCVAAFDAFAAAAEGVPLPGYTHLQRAMPSTLGRWAGAWASLLRMDRPLLDAAATQVSASPLGSAAGYGVPEVLPVDRPGTAAELGFESVLEPSEAAQPSRGKAEATLLFALAQVATTLGKWAWDVCLFSSAEFGFLKLPAQFTTGSSIMPQKRNPDVVELTRGKAVVVRAALQELMGIAGPLPSGYHRDLQLLKAPLFRGVDLAMSMLGMTAHVMRGLQVDAERCRAAMTEDLVATEEAYRLVREGVPFREAYRRVGKRFSG
jgi:argininosuccinate lyase